MHYVPQGVDYAILGGYDVYRVMDSRQDVVLSEEDFIERFKGAESALPEEYGQSMRNADDDGEMDGIDRARVEGFDVHAPQASASTHVQTGDNAAVVVAVNGDMTICPYGTDLVTSITAGNAAILYPNTSFLLRGLKAMLVRPLHA
jgi:hypothetical protein